MKHALRVFGTAAVLACSSAAVAQSDPFDRIGGRSIDLRAAPEIGLQASNILFFCHDGNFDLYDLGRPASDALAAYVGGGNPELLYELAEAQGAAVWAFGFEPQTLNGPYEPWVGAPVIGVPVPPERSPCALHVTDRPFLSYLIRFYPSDDLFAANDDPRRFRMFDREGHALGPLRFEIHGSELLDAGVRANDEQDLLRHDAVEWFEPLEQALVRDEDEVIRPHPGFIGAARQGGGIAAGRLLGDEAPPCVVGGCPVYAADALDFTRPGSALARFEIWTERRYLHGAWSGSYFDEARDGEGFSIDFVGNDPDQVIVYWYTYRADGSGKPLWLIGQGTKSESRDPDNGMNVAPDMFDYALNLYVTEGGTLGSTLNPEQAELVPWGTARLRMDFYFERIGASSVVPGCSRAFLWRIVPEDGAIELDLPDSEFSLEGKTYTMNRLGPYLTSADVTCEG